MVRTNIVRRRRHDRDIALFGEQVAKQYLSQSLGWLENLIFACAPLGIITAVTCAIRVGGPTALRALIGRSQERNVQIELDILTYTNLATCQLYRVGVFIVLF